MRKVLLATVASGAARGEASFFGVMTSRFFSRRFFKWHKLSGALDSFVAWIGVLNLKGWQI